MRPYVRWFLFLAGCAAALTAAPADRLGRMTTGDDTRYAEPGFDDRDWPTVENETLPMRAGPGWLRLRLSAPAPGEGLRRGGFYSWPEDVEGAPIDSVFLSPAFTFELYWDGRLLERNGIVGRDAATEKAGTLNRLVRIPPELLGPGEHVVALRISSHHYNFPATQSAVYLTMENYERRLTYEARRPVLPLIGVGAALLVATVCGVFYGLVERRRPLLLGSVLGLAMAVFYGLISLRWLFNLTYDSHCPRLTAITATMAVIAILLPWMLLEQFALPRVRAWLLSLLPLLIAAWLSSPIYEVKALWLCRAMLAVSLVAVSWAVWRRRPGAWFVLCGIVAGLVAVRTSRRVFLDSSFFILFEVLVLFPLAALGLQLRAERRRAHEASLAAARLETELLKKNIQPHFLINTLATVMEVIEREPQAAIALIEALAAEFRILARVSGEALIPLGQELALCHAHLRIMSMRKDARCTLVTEGVDDGALVPPALLHTLVENGLTHLRPRNGEQRFTLHVHRTATETCYTLTAEGEPARSRTAPVPDASREGTGLRYIKARLEESFPGRWRLESAPVTGGWRTSIVIESAAFPASSGRSAGLVTGRAAGLEARP
ncbi:MAG TPA: histidine kinase [Opitutaceae bacterium]|nr:histidine kinase [Opitutaceae bacterium]